MRVLNISAEINGQMVPVGTITGNDPSDATFNYLEEYCSGPSPAQLSISLPVRKEPFSPSATSAFFEGLLPEGFTRRSVSQWLKVDEGDYLSILNGLGRECLGAICVTEDDVIPQASYEPVPTEQIRQLAEEGVSKSTELITKTHLSLAGASGKVGLYYDADYDAWYMPHGTAPSTHIVKQSHIRLDNVVLNEQLSLRTAARCGISVPESFIINTGSGEDHEILFATARYDRIFDGSEQQINGLARPLRLHQEDFAQAMGIPASQKYENEDLGYLKGMFEVLRMHSADPITDMTDLWDRIVFNCLIGNTDAHIKNYSILYSSDWKSIRLAPAYDIISTTIYGQSTRNLAFRIGNATTLDEIDPETLITAAHSIGIGERMAKERVKQISGRFIGALDESAYELANVGYDRAFEIRDRILDSGIMQKFERGSARMDL